MLKPSIADQVIQSWIDTRNLYPFNVTDAELNAMMWQLANTCECPPHRARAAIVESLRHRRRTDAPHTGTQNTEPSPLL